MPNSKVRVRVWVRVRVRVWVRVRVRIIEETIRMRGLGLAFEVHRSSLYTTHAGK